MILADMGWLYDLQHAAPPNIDVWFFAIVDYFDRWYTENPYTSHIITDGACAALAWINWKLKGRPMIFIKKIFLKKKE